MFTLLCSDVSAHGGAQNHEWLIAEAESDLQHMHSEDGAFVDEVHRCTICELQAVLRILTMGEGSECRNNVQHPFHPGGGDR